VRYDIVFVRREPGASWEDTFAAHQESIEDTGSNLRLLSPAEIETWDRMLPKVRELLGDGEVEVTDDAEILRELVHVPTGIELTMSADEASITVPYRFTGDEALAIMHTVYALARYVEQETGLEGYDIQLDEPITDPARTADSISRRSVDQQAAEQAREALRTARTPQQPPAAAPYDASSGLPGQDGGDAAREPGARRTAPWWQFWRR
jgi:hypothetical protein